jgi:hypothetical protein
LNLDSIGGQGGARRRLGRPRQGAKTPNLRGARSKLYTFCIALMIMSAMAEYSDSPSRRSPRIEVFAQAQVRGSDTHIVSIRNVSSGGCYLEGTLADYPELKPGVDFNLVIFGSEEGMGDDPDFNISCRAKVIRVDAGFPDKRPPGFGCTIDPIDQDHRDRLTNLLLRADGFRTGKIP